MRSIKVGAVAVLWLGVLATAVSAQDGTPQAEIFGGYSYLRVNPGGSGVNVPGGWHASVAGNFNSWFGLAGDFSGHYKSVSGASANAHVFTFGPRFTARASESVQPFVHVQVGGARAGVGLGPVGVSDTSFAAVLGGGVDVKVGSRVAWRVGQLDYVLTRFGGSEQHNVRFSTGIVIRLGSK